MGTRLPILVPADDMLAIFSGVQKGSSWSPGDGEPLDGIYVLDWLGGYLYRVVIGLLDINAERDEVAINISGRNDEGIVNFLTMEPLNPSEVYNNQLPATAEFYGGTCTVTMSDGHLVDPRYTSDLILIGQLEGQTPAFFEPVPLAASETRRYARQSDHTRVYIRRSEV